MNKTIKWVGIASLVLLFAAAFTSCNTTRHLGCPMKITMTAVLAHQNAC